jgi:hypothetical protein
MITPEKDLAEQLEHFEDTDLLAQRLYDMAHEMDDLSIESGDRYWLMEARDNLLGLYDLCRSYAIHARAREHKAKYGYDPLNKGDA